VLDDDKACDIIAIGSLVVGVLYAVQVLDGDKACDIIAIGSLVVGVL